MEDLQTSQNKKCNKKVIVYFLIAFGLILLDQVTKMYFKGFNLFGFSKPSVGYGAQIPVIGTFLQFTYIENPGMAFGITFGAGKIFLSLFSIIAATALGYFLTKIKNASVWVKLGFTLILAGAVGNLIDRVFYGVLYGEQPLFYGYVVDFIQVDIPDVNIFGLHYSYFPIFNIADSCVTCGVILLMIVQSKIPALGEIFPRFKKNVEINNDNQNSDNK